MHIAAFLHIEGEGFYLLAGGQRVHLKAIAGKNGTQSYWMPSIFVLLRK
ncbi:hypothetical protein KIS4809_1229 [Bacillus sp. ZZV12-4809]|nr:hypothetical protein KIS4809_1229 [Bacillus sp. ZZV12-4809]